MAKTFLTFSAVMGLFSVIFGAFGAHMLKARLDEYSLEVYQTGVTYQFFHTFALALVALLLLRGDLSWFRWSGWSFLLGTLIFSGTLYLLAFTGVRTWGAVTPIGGVLLIVGWVFLFVGILKSSF